MVGGIRRCWGGGVGWFGVVLVRMLEAFGAGSVVRGWGSWEFWAGLPAL